MNANITPPTAATFPSVSSSSRLPQHQTWIMSYDEEWVAFVAERALKKDRPGINPQIPEMLPRVWNNPK